MRGFLLSILAAEMMAGCGCGEKGIAGHADAALDPLLDENDPPDSITDVIDTTSDDVQDIAQDYGFDARDSTPVEEPNCDADADCIPNNCPCTFSDECC